MEGLVHKLWKEPLFHFSLASKELFHSNFLAWLAERWPNEMADVFKPVVVPNARCQGAAPEREHRNLDLILRFEGYEPLVIENKMFSIPRAEQLRKYTAAIARVENLARASCCILTPIAPDWLSKASGWVHLGYADLIAGIDELRHSVHDATEYELQTIANYVRMVRWILQLVQLATHDLERQTFALAVELRRSLERVRLADGLGKLRADSVRALLESRLSEGLSTSMISVASGLTRKKPLLELFHAASENVDIGWQLQEDQWRLALRTRVVHRPDVTERIKLAEANSDWFNFAPLLAAMNQELPPPRVRSNLGPWRKFDPDFVYQYRKVPGISVAQVIDAGLEYARLAAGFTPSEPPGAKSIARGNALTFPPPPQV